jgi:hypothetical protein
MAQPLGLIPFFPQTPAPAEAAETPPAKALGLMSFGVRFALSANQLDLLRDALLHLPVGCKSSFSASASPHFALVCRDYFSRMNEPAYRLYRNGHLLFSMTDRREFLERVRSCLTLYVAEGSRRRLFLRAGVAGWGDQAILLLGRPGTGKTTLLSQLLRAGATYYSDQFAVVDKDGMVYPYTCPLQIRESQRRTQRLAEEFGGIAGCEPLPVGGVLLSSYKPEARWRPRRLTPEAGVARLLEHAVVAKKSSGAAPASLQHIAEHALFVQGVRGEASSVVTWLTGRFGRARGISPEARRLFANMRRSAGPPGESIDWQ